MKRSKRYYDEWAERLAAGNRDPGDEDAVSAFVTLLRSGLADEPADSQLPATLAAEVLRFAEDVPDRTRTVRRRTVRPLTMRWRRRAMISTFLSTLLGKIVAGGLAVAVAATGAAATGTLPDAAQQRAADAFGGIGIEVPAPDRAPEEGIGDGTDYQDDGTVAGSRETTPPVLPEEASDTAKAVIGTVFGGDPAEGRDFGQAVARTASGGAVNGVPETPSAPDSPVIPDRPSEPATPGSPEIPNRPGVPGIPERPETPELPDDASEGLGRRP